jgi:Coenzyme PQQ synthesis protein D (PqqD)
MSASLHAVYRRSDRMVGRKIAEEHVLVPIVGHGADLDSIFTLNRVAAFIWDRIDGQTEGAAIVEAVIQRFDVSRMQAERDYARFVEQLASVEAVLPAGKRE